MAIDLHVGTLGLPLKNPEVEERMAKKLKSAKKLSKTLTLKKK
jgi:hypothetical protein